MPGSLATFVVVSCLLLLALPVADAKNGGRKATLWPINHQTKVLHLSQVDQHGSWWRVVRGKQGRQTSYGKLYVADAGKLDVRAEQRKKGDTTYTEEVFVDPSRQNIWGKSASHKFVAPILGKLQKQSGFPMVAIQSETSKKLRTTRIYHLDGFPFLGVDTIRQRRRKRGRVDFEFTRQDRRGKVLFSFRGKAKGGWRRQRSLEQIKRRFDEGASDLAQLRGPALLTELDTFAAAGYSGLEDMGLDHIRDKKQMAEFFRIMAAREPIARYRLAEKARLMLSETQPLDPKHKQALQHAIEKMPSKGPKWPRARSISQLLKHLNKGEGNWLSKIHRLTHPEEILTFARFAVEQDTATALISLRDLAQLTGYGQKFRAAGTHGFWVRAYEEVSQSSRRN